MVNIELADKVHKFITANPNQYNQKDWSTESENECGTQACVAGWAAIIGLDIPLTKDEGGVCPCGCGEEYGPMYAYQEPLVGWRAAGREALGISEELATCLFRGSNDRKRTIEAVRMLADGADESAIIAHLPLSCGCGDCDSYDE